MGNHSRRSAGTTSCSVCHGFYVAAQITCVPGQEDVRGTCTDCPPDEYNPTPGGTCVPCATPSETTDGLSGQTACGK